MKFKAAKFTRTTNSEFLVTLRSRVNQYFKEKKISKHANAAMVFKTIFMFTLFFAPYGILLSGLISGNLVLFFLMWVLMSMGAAGIGFSIMHDANHGSYSRNPKINNALGFSINVLGGNASNWIIQHNILHHTYTNVDHLDEDINPGGVIRLCPHQKKLKVHRFQHIYAWFLYGLMTIMWVTTKDIRQIYRYKKMDLIKMLKRPFGSLLTEMIVLKVIYFSYILVIPFLVMSEPWWLILLGFLLMHFLLGLTLACVFQLAHVMPNMSYPLPDENGNMENHWAIHQLLTTSNFSPKSKLLSWFIGGLNFQIEHHLFPNICHVHYKEISKIVKQTTREFGLPYYCQPNFIIALWNHGKMLKALG